MKSTRMLVLNAIVFLTSSFATAGRAGDDHNNSADDYKKHGPPKLPQKVATLVWSDEFDGTTLDLKKWDYEVDCWGGGNNEQQCYVNNKENVFVQDGILTLKTIRVPGGYKGTKKGCTNNNDNSCMWIQPCTSGRIRTLESVDGHWLYGRFEFRAKLPKGDFLWPAIWMLPQDNVYGTWAASGEIDIVELRGQRRNVLEHTLHYGGQWPSNKMAGSGQIEYDQDFTEGFHNFTFQWEPDLMTWAVDGVVSYSQALNQSFGKIYPKNGQPWDQSFHLILNQAVGGNFFNEYIYGRFDPDTTPSTWTYPNLEIDYIRIYQLE